MLQIHRPLCPNLTLRLTQISPEYETKTAFTSFIHNETKGVMLFSHSADTGKYRDVDEGKIIDRMVHRGIGLLENSERVELKTNGSASQFERAHLSHIITGLCGGESEGYPKNEDCTTNTSTCESETECSLPTHFSDETSLMQKSLADELEEVQVLDDPSNNVFLPSSLEPKNLPYYAMYLKNQENKYIDREMNDCYCDGTEGDCTMCSKEGKERNSQTAKCHFCNADSVCDCRAKVIDNVISCCKDMMRQNHENEQSGVIAADTTSSAERLSGTYADAHLSSHSCDGDLSHLNSLAMSQTSPAHNGADYAPDARRDIRDIGASFQPHNGFSYTHRQIPSSASSFLPSFVEADRKAGLSINTVYMDLEVTHRGMHRFIPRHSNEIAIETGDPLHVKVEADDLWCEGINLCTGEEGIFPSMYATNLDFLEDDVNDDGDLKKFNLRFLGSLQVKYHKGDEVICQAIAKVVLRYRTSNKRNLPPLCLLEINEYGLRMIDRSKSAHESDNFSHFFALKNISFCGHHPQNQRYFAFITKHPHHDRFACHVLMGERSTKAVSEAVGWAFSRFYQEYMAFTHQTEDIYIE